MSSAGHIIDMVNRARYNERMVKMRRERIRRIRDEYFEHLNVYGAVHISDEKISKEKLDRIRERIREKIKRETRNQIIKTATLTVIIASGLLWFFLTYRFHGF